MRGIDRQELTDGSGDVAGSEVLNQRVLENVDTKGPSYPESVVNQFAHAVSAMRDWTTVSTIDQGVEGSTEHITSMRYKLPRGPDLTSFDEFTARGMPSFGPPVMRDYSRHPTGNFRVLKFASEQNRVSDASIRRSLKTPETAIC